jgi:hypothetical protein
MICSDNPNTNGNKGFSESAIMTRASRIHAEPEVAALSGLFSFLIATSIPTVLSLQTSTQPNVPSPNTSFCQFTNNGSTTLSAAHQLCRAIIYNGKRLLPAVNFLMKLAGHNMSVISQRQVVQ